MNIKNMLLHLSIFAAVFAGMGLNAEIHNESVLHEVAEVNEWNTRLASGELSPEAKEDALRRIAAISTPEYVVRERCVNLMNEKFAELHEKKRLCADSSRFLILSAPCTEAIALKRELFDLNVELRQLCDKATETDAYKAWYSNFGK